MLRRSKKYLCLHILVNKMRILQFFLLLINPSPTYNQHIRKYPLCILK